MENIHTTTENESFNILVQNIKTLNHTLQQSAANAINRHVTCRNWLVGYYIIHYEQNGSDRAIYGEMLLKNLADKLKGDSFSYRNLKLYRQFYVTYKTLSIPIKEYFMQHLSIGQSEIAQLQISDTSINMIGQSLIAQSEEQECSVPAQMLFERLSYTHLVQLLPLRDPLERTFYEMECIKGTWSVRELKRQIGSRYFQRSGLSFNKSALCSLANQGAAQTNLQEVIKSPFTFEFLELSAKDVVEESDLETALMNHLQEFMLELGAGFCFEARQKRILIDNNYYFYDLLFYNRFLHCGVIIELKSNELNYKDVAQLNMYLAYYRKNLMSVNDNPPVGILLCTSIGEEMVEYATAGIDENLFISQYLLKLPSKKELENWLRDELSKIQ
ncbi:PDDEXK nuclease domain-containing protein [Bacteroides sp.]|uniref:PDDEXK nuclease domain-containing protein n=1 Tax=Bacteroides sp. TaxID=29523 RepID=UPI003AB423B6